MTLSPQVKAARKQQLSLRNKLFNLLKKKA